MLVRVDREADALYLELTSAVIEESEEISDGVILDYDKAGNLFSVAIRHHALLVVVQHVRIDNL